MHIYTYIMTQNCRRLKYDQSEIPFTADLYTVLLSSDFGHFRIQWQHKYCQTLKELDRIVFHVL